MLDTFFAQATVLARMKVSPMGLYLSELARTLHDEGFARDAVRRRIRAAEHFGVWLQEERRSIASVNGETVGRYLAQLPRLSSPSSPKGRQPQRLNSNKGT